MEVSLHLGKKNEPLEKQQPEYYLDRIELALKNIQKHRKHTIRFSSCQKKEFKLANSKLMQSWRKTAVETICFPLMRCAP